MVLRFRSLRQNWIKIPWRAFPLSSFFPLPPLFPAYLNLASNRSRRISTSTWTRIRWKGCLNPTHLTQPFQHLPVLQFSPSHTLPLISSWSLRYWKKNPPLHGRIWLKLNGMKYLWLHVSWKLTCPFILHFTCYLNLFEHNMYIKFKFKYIVKECLHILTIACPCVSAWESPSTRRHRRMLWTLHGHERVRFHKGNAPKLCLQCSRLAVVIHIYCLVISITQFCLDSCNIDYPLGRHTLLAAAEYFILFDWDSAY